LKELADFFQVDLLQLAYRVSEKSQYLLFSYSSHSNLGKLLLGNTVQEKVVLYTNKLIITSLYIFICLLCMSNFLLKYELIIMDSAENSQQHPN